MLILHLSDLHIGPHSRFAGDDPQEIARAFARELSQARSNAEIDDGIDLVCVTGDITEAALPAQFEQAASFFTTLAEEIGVPRRRVVFVPGNHDVSWIACKRVALDQEEQGFDEDELRRRFDQDKLEHYLGFVRSVWGVGIEKVARPLDGCGFLLDFQELQLSVAALSSCEQESHRSQDHVGRLRVAQTQTLIGYWQEAAAESLLKLVCVHHNPVGVPPVVSEDWRKSLRGKRKKLEPELIDRFASTLAGFEGREYLRAITEQCRVQLVLHGHQHARGEQPWPWTGGPGMTHVMAAGSWGLTAGTLPCEEPASARLITLDTDAGIIRAHTLSNLAWARIKGSVKTGGLIVDREVYDQRLDPPPAWISEPEATATIESGPAAEEIRHYCEAAETQHGTLPLAGFQTKLRVPLDLAELYVPLQAMIDLRGLGDACFADACDAEAQLREAGGSSEIPLLDAFREATSRRRSGLVILGDPGSGKTTHLKRLLLWCLRQGGPSLGLAEGVLPVFLPLRDLHDLGQGLDAFIEAQLEGPHLKAEPGFGRRLLERGNLLLLLDGLDEVADPDQREQVARWLEQGLVAHPACRLVVTCRFAGYTPEARLSERFLELHLRPLTSEQMTRFVHSWYRIVETGLAPDPEQGAITAQERAKELVARLLEPDFRARRVFELTRNPLLLTNLCLVHRDRGQLPQRRAKLYDECIEVLLERWREAKHLAVGISAETGRRVLQPLALWLHQEDGRTRATAAEIAPVIEPVLRQVKYDGGGAREFLATVRDESGLLTGWGHDQYGFMHLGFQEYLAAREISRRSYDDPSVLRELASHFGDSWWQEVSLLLLALEELPLFAPFMREVLRQSAVTRHPDMLEACLDDALDFVADPFVELAMAPAGSEPEHWSRQLAALRVVERLAPEEMQRLVQKLRQHPSPEVRSWLGRRAVQAAEQVIRPEPSGYELVLIPGGTFQMGSPESEAGRTDREGPVHEVAVGSFYLGRYPVTNEEYGRFLRANPDAPEPEYWGDRSRNQPRQPVVGVSWQDARRYAAWAGLSLPSEAEWEFACRAGTTTRYSSGDSEEDLKRIGWYRGDRREGSAPAGEKEPNQLGLYDMHGNVWEWCEDDWHECYDEAPADGRAWVDEPRGVYRVLRGGSWIDFGGSCRSAYRSAYEPGYRYDGIGFRLSRGQE